MSKRKNRSVGRECETPQAEQNKETIQEIDQKISQRDKELDTLRKQQQKDNSLEKDAFDIVAEMSGAGL